MYSKTYFSLPCTAYIFKYYIERRCPSLKKKTISTPSTLQIPLLFILLPQKGRKLHSISTLKACSGPATVERLAGI